MSQDNFITITLRSHVPPTACADIFDLGKPFQVKVKRNSTLNECLEQLFTTNKKHIGFTSINGRLAKEDTTLSEGDVVFVYSLASGG
ncbi:MAG: hypothetical protein ACOX0T_06270 [Pelotomaculum sp.]|jgi:sulfur carrier protein ThiS